MTRNKERLLLLLFFLVWSENDGGVVSELQMKTVKLWVLADENFLKCNVRICMLHPSTESGGTDHNETARLTVLAIPQTSD
jgi:hypothetical protein